MVFKSRKIPKVYQILLADVLIALESIGTPVGENIDYYDLRDLTYCGHLADHGESRRKHKSTLHLFQRRKADKLRSMEGLHCELP